jgi:hypothetical protein
MKLRILTTLVAVAGLAIIGCGDDITNIIEQVPPTAEPTSAGSPTSTPTEDVRPDTPTPTPRDTTCRTPEEGEEIICGDGICLAPEECDIGGICVGGTNELDPCFSPDDCDGGRCTVVGGQPVDPQDPEGDSCSANCTLESVRTANYDENTRALVQALALGVPVPLAGSQTIQTGAPRDDETVDINGDVTFVAGDLPMVTKAPDIRIEPAQVLGLVCACVRGIEVPAFGAGNAATGVISCGGTLDDIDVMITQDHHTDPLDDFQPLAECSHDPDPECDNENEIVTGVVSRSCREQQDPDCSDPATNRHAGVCNSPRDVTYSGSGPAGSAIIFNNTAIGLLSDRGECNMGVAGMDPCPFADYGPDCIPCTDDDADFGVPENNPTTTGTTTSIVYNASNRANAVIIQSSNTPCTSNDDCTVEVCGASESCLENSDGDMVCGVRCGGSGPCQTSQTGSPFDCEELAANPSGGLSGGAFAVTFPSIDAATIGDNVTSVLFSFE